MEHASDAELAERTVRGDDAAFAELVRRYQNAVYEMACRMLRDRDAGLDASQEIFLKAHGALARYDPQRRFSTWVFAIARNHCIDQLRRPSSRPTAPLDDESRLATDPAPGPGRAAEDAEAATIVERAVGELPDIYREAVELYHFQDVSYAEAAELQGVPIGTFMARLHRARKILRDRLRPVLGTDDDEAPDRRDDRPAPRSA